MVANRKKRRRVKNAVLNVIAVIVFVISLGLVYQVGNEIIDTIRLNENLRQVKAQLEILEQEYEFLVLQKDKLLDPEYVKNYARFGYMLSKEGEQIFFLPEKSNDE